MALYRFFFAPVLLAVAVVAGRAERTHRSVPAAEIRSAPAMRAAPAASAEPAVPAAIPARGRGALRAEPVR